MLFSGLLGLNLKELGIPTDVEYMKKYCKDMNIDDVKDWNVYMAFSFFRLTAIGQGVYKRALEGTNAYSKTCYTPCMTVYDYNIQPYMVLPYYHIFA